MIRTAGYNPGFFWLAVLTALSTVALIGLGGVVTSKGVGLSVPDWPNSYGYNMFLLPVSHWVGGILWEHTHRLAASLVGLMTLVMAIWAHGPLGRALLKYLLFPLLLLAGIACYFPGGEGIRQTATGHLLCLLGAVSLGVGCFWPRSWKASPGTRLLALVALVWVVGQGILGGMRVVTLENYWGAVHAAAAQIFLILACVLALCSSRWWILRRWDRIRPVFSRIPAMLLLLLSLLIFAQLVVGASMRHRHAGLPVSTFPLVDGKFLPEATPQAVEEANRERSSSTGWKEFEPVTRGHILLYRYHLILAVLILLASVSILWISRLLCGPHILVNLQFFILSIVAVQAALGASTVWSGKAADIATLHVVCGALLLASTTLTGILGLRFSGAASPKERQVSAGRYHARDFLQAGTSP